MRTGKVVNNIFEARNTLTQRTAGPQCTGTIAIETSGMNDGDHAGLAAFCSEPGTIGIVKEEGQKYITMTDRGNEKGRIKIDADRVYLKMLCDFTTDDATFYYSLDDKQWLQLGGKFHMIFSMAHFTGNKFAIFNYSTASAGGFVDIDYFKFKQL